MKAQTAVLPHLDEEGPKSSALLGLGQLETLSGVSAVIQCHGFKVFCTRVLAVLPHLFEF